MVGGAGVDAHGARAALPGGVDGGAQKGRPDALADHMRHEAEIGEVHVDAAARVEFEEARRFAVAVEDVDFDR